MKRLIHIDFSFMKLCEDDICQILISVKESGLLSIHLSGNYFADCERFKEILEAEEEEELFVAMKTAVKGDVY